MIAITDPRFLPTTIIMHIETLFEYDDIVVQDYMDMIRTRLKKEVQIGFDLKALEVYIQELKEKKKNLLPIPISKSEMNLNGEKYVNKLDNSPIVDYQNNSQLLQYFKKEGIERMQLLKKTQVDRQEIIIELEAMFMKYMEIMSNIIDKQEKLRLNFQESGQYRKQIKEEIDKLFIIIKSVMRRNLSKEQYDTIVQDIINILKLQKGG